jgi:predicted ArsR family transcriptional regulator
MKTIKELAEELGVNKEAIRQSIANKVSRKPQKTAVL